MDFFSDHEEEQGATLVDPARRRALRLGLSALPFLSASLLLPSSLWAASGLPKKGKMPTAPIPESKPRPPRLLMLDPGHGGHDPGAIGLSGTYEKDITLDIARRMAAAFAGEPSIKVQLTREHDVFLPLSERVEIGCAARADLFLSIHADSAPNHGARGLSVYTLSEKASDQFASQLADKENHADAAGGLNVPVDDKEVAAILFDLAARHTRNTAQRVKVGFIKGMGRRWDLLEQPMRAANFAVLRSPEVPSMLVETGFLSNKLDEALLTKPLQRQKIATLMAKELAFLLKSPLFG
ncbi:MAG: N-acetylmuramoyl-L-alanine amidase [Bdellovibrionales bacterium]|jgi:N-acetylmuramoyl-L-alanine amidase